MRINPPPEDHRIEVTVVPMVNVVFLLLIFFMLVGRIVPSSELEVSPPISRSGQAQSGEPVRIIVPADGHIVIGEKETDIAALDAAVAAILDSDPERQFQLKADAALEANRLIYIMEILRQAGVRELTLLTERAFQ